MSDSYTAVCEVINKMSLSKYTPSPLLTLPSGGDGGLASYNFQNDLKKISVVLCSI